MDSGPQAAPFGPAFSVWQCAQRVGDGDTVQRPVLELTWAGGPLPDFAWFPHQRAPSVTSKPLKRLQPVWGGGGGLARGHGFGLPLAAPIGLSQLHILTGSRGLLVGVGVLGAGALGEGGGRASPASKCLGSSERAHSIASGAGSEAQG